MLLSTFFLHLQDDKNRVSCSSVHPYTILAFRGYTVHYMAGNSVKKDAYQDFPSEIEEGYASVVIGNSLGTFVPIQLHGLR